MLSHTIPDAIQSRVSLASGPTAHESECLHRYVDGCHRLQQSSRNGAFGLYEEAIHSR